MTLSKIKELYQAKEEAERKYREADPRKVDSEYLDMKNARRDYTDACVLYCESELAFLEL